MANSEKGGAAAVAVMGIVSALGATGGSVPELMTRLWETRSVEVKVRARALPEIYVGGDTDEGVKAGLEVGPHEWTYRPGGTLEKEISGRLGGSHAGLVAGWGRKGQSMGIELPVAYRGVELVLIAKGKLEGGASRSTD